MHRRRSHDQSDLFHLGQPVPRLHPERSRELLPLVRDLLGEILSGLTAGSLKG